jgi:hypothetical protein
VNNDSRSPHSEDQPEQVKQGFMDKSLRLNYELGSVHLPMTFEHHYSVIHLNPEKSDTMPIPSAWKQ